MDAIRIEKLVRKIEKEADDLFGIRVKRLKILYSLKGASAGVCSYDKKYNFNLWIARNNKNFEQTVYHEVAHQIAIQVYGFWGKGHGRCWKVVMNTLGRTPDRCHKYKFKPARKTTNYSYQCSGCDLVYTLSSIRYNRAKRGEATYICKCKTKIDINKAKKA